MKLSIFVSIIIHTFAISSVVYFNYVKQSDYYMLGNITEVSLSIDKLENQKDIYIKNEVQEKKVKKNLYDNNLENIEYLHEKEFYEHENVSKDSETNNGDNLENEEYISAIVKGYIEGVPLPLPYYPSYAKKHGISGTCIVDITIDYDGSVNKVTIVESSGYKVLDNAVKETIEKKWRLPKPKNIITVRKIFTFELK